MFIENNVHKGSRYLAELFKRDGLVDTIISAEQRIPKKADGPVAIQRDKW